MKTALLWEEYKNVHRRWNFEVFYKWDVVTGRTLSQELLFDWCLVLNLLVIFPSNMDMFLMKQILKQIFCPLFLFNKTKKSFMLSNNWFQKRKLAGSFNKEGEFCQRSCTAPSITFSKEDHIQSLLKHEKDPSYIDFLEKKKSATVNSASNCQLFMQNSSYLLHEPHTLGTIK